MFCFIAAKVRRGISDGVLAFLGLINRAVIHSQDGSGIPVIGNSNALQHIHLEADIHGLIGYAFDLGCLPIKDQVQICCTHGHIVRTVRNPQRNSLIALNGHIRCLRIFHMNIGVVNDTVNKLFRLGILCRKQCHIFCHYFRLDGIYDVDRTIVVTAVVGNLNGIRARLGKIQGLDIRNKSGFHLNISELEVRSGKVAACFNCQRISNIFYQQKIPKRHSGNQYCQEQNNDHPLDGFC